MRVRRLLRPALGAVILLATTALLAPAAHAAQGAVRVAALLDPPTVSSTSWGYLRVFTQPPYISPPVSVTATGGVPPYSYAWQKISGDHATNAASPTGSSTGWQRPIPPNGHSGVWSSQWRCLVTDSLGIMAYTPVVSVTFEWENGD
ncbi:hypothetical protein [Nonomuraea sp. NPDC050643]|uniref:hypothetical protein n=1 Tax=Nonomuraea sp. NPDC050643 TaxID=3155660 RepID=UPI0034049DAA